jgi:hypothetical protein
VAKFLKKSVELSTNLTDNSVNLIECYSSKIFQFLSHINYISAEFSQFPMNFFKFFKIRWNQWKTIFKPNFVTLERHTSSIPNGISDTSRTKSQDQTEYTSAFEEGRHDVAFFWQGKCSLSVGTETTATRALKKILWFPVFPNPWSEHITRQTEWARIFAIEQNYLSINLLHMFWWQFIYTS